MMLLVFAIAIATVNGALLGEEEKEKTEGGLPPHEWKVLLNNPVENAITGQPVNSTDGFLVSGGATLNGERSMQKRIISGQTASRGEHPEICSLQRMSGSTWFHTCGAVVYSANTIITAAHCVRGNIDLSRLRVRCGEFNIRQTEGSEQTSGVSTVTSHPDFSLDSSRGFPNDIALLELTSPLTFTRFVQPAVIADENTRLRRYCKILGWGRTESGALPDELRDVTIRRLTNDECNSRWTGLINENHVCFKDIISFDNGCNGDSGGPAKCGDVTVGVTSWGRSGCLTLYFPVVYTRLSGFRTWITDNAF